MDNDALIGHMMHGKHVVVADLKGREDFVSKRQRARRMDGDAQKDGDEPEYRRQHSHSGEDDLQ